ncbi:MAG: hypothetical protein SCALA702_01510 [Melioribacteraceae bacterium]|nr:MAG: hypothetical protein SCALA702_01510 [Melioribacteraceae bacterium]
MNIRISIQEFAQLVDLFSVSKNNSYSESYPVFLDYFSRLNEIKEKDLIIGAHFVYGWMPTILKLNLEKSVDVLFILNRVKKGIEVTFEELSLLKEVINNSIVGVSKLLHFINPCTYAIWDSRISSFVSMQTSTHNVNRVESYVEYMKALHMLVNQKEFKSLYRKIQLKYKYRIEPLRAAEVVLFEAGKTK